MWMLDSVVLQLLTTISDFGGSDACQDAMGIKLLEKSSEAQKKEPHLNRDFVT